ncbi:sensor histidine kinase [Mucilaginibacter panaciglaebae]|uniref:histidine kinase n=1 Tax=Mucilaginibacter panaciglaebae TaxID=502331 RepID=A0ABP7WCC8_9SPHI
MKKILLILCCLIQNLGVFAQKTDTLVIHDDESRYLTNSYFLELEDPRNKILARDIIYNHNFHRINDQFPRLEYSKTITWLKFTLKNASRQSTVPITISRSVIDEFDVYFIDSNKTGPPRLRHLSAKDASNSSNLLTQSITLVEAPLEPDSSITLFARIKSNATTVIPIQINSADLFITRRGIENLINGAVMGMFAIMALYNLMLFIIVGDKNYLYYSIYIVFLSLTQGLQLGFGNNLFSGNLRLLNNYIIPLTRICFGYTLLWFAGNFLRFKQNVKKPFYKFYQFLYVLYALPLLATLYGYTDIAYSLITFAIFTTCLTLIMLVTILYTRGFNPAKFFIMGWGLFLIAILISICKNYGVVPYNYFTANIVVYSGLIELILFSVALADQINFYRRQNTESQLAALAIAKENERLITEQNISLENKVKDRTQELIQTNQSLSVTIDNLKSAQIQLVETEKMASLGLLTAGVAHEINNPINFVGANVSPLRLDMNELIELLGKFEIAANNPDKPELLIAAKEYKEKIDSDFLKEEIHILLNGIEDGANRTAEIVQSLRTFSRIDEPALTPTNINTAILNTLVILRSAIPYYIEVKPILNTLEPLNCYTGKINQALLNLINNSIQAIEAKKEHHKENITIYTHDFPDHITIEIMDTGIGMSNEVRQRIFEPFFTTKNVGEGTGLGLSIVFGIIEKHNGTIQVQSSPNIGSKFTVTLPKHLTNSEVSPFD